VAHLTKRLDRRHAPPEVNAELLKVGPSLTPAARSTPEIPHCMVIGKIAHRTRARSGMRGVRREALRHIPGIAGKDWRDVLGSDVLPGAERLRGKEHDRKPAAGSRYQGRCAGDPRDTVKAKLPEA
jgi:hypothetical protein